MLEALLDTIKRFKLIHMYGPSTIELNIGNFYDLKIELESKYSCNVLSHVSGHEGEYNAGMKFMDINIYSSLFPKVGDAYFFHNQTFFILKILTDNENDIYNIIE